MNSYISWFGYAVVVGAAEYYVGVLLFALPFGRYWKQAAHKLMSGTLDPLIFLVIMNFLAAFLASQQSQVNNWALTIVTSSQNTFKELQAYQQQNVNIVIDVGIAATVIAFARDLLQAILGLGIPDPYLDMSLGAQAAELVQQALAPASTVYGIAVLMQGFLTAFIQMIVVGWAFLADLGAFFYILPFRLGRRAGRFLISFAIVSYVMIPVYGVLQQFVEDWSQSQSFNFVFNLPPIQTALMNITLPAIYFGFIGWIAGGLAAGSALQSLASRITDLSPLGGINTVTGMIRGAISMGGGFAGRLGSRVAWDLAGNEITTAQTEARQVDKYVLPKGFLSEEAAVLAMEGNKFLADAQKLYSRYGSGQAGQATREIALSDGIKSVPAEYVKSTVRGLVGARLSSDLRPKPKPAQVAYDNAKQAQQKYREALAAEQKARIKKEAQAKKAQGQEADSASDDEYYAQLMDGENQPGAGSLQDWVGKDSK